MVVPETNCVENQLYRRMEFVRPVVLASCREGMYHKKMCFQGRFQTFLPEGLKGWALWLPHCRFLLRCLSYAVQTFKVHKSVRLQCLHYGHPVCGQCDIQKNVFLEPI